MTDGDCMCTVERLNMRSCVHARARIPRYDRSVSTMSCSFEGQCEIEQSTRYARSKDTDHCGANGDEQAHQEKNASDMHGSLRARETKERRKKRKETRQC